jgi:hypothetical protein
VRLKAPRELRFLLASAGCTLLAACAGGGSPPPPQIAAASSSTVTATPAAGPHLRPDGRCDGDPLVIASQIEPGIGECDLVRLKGRAPTDVLIGESGRGHREVQVLYAEPGGRELYFFVDNRLDRVVR